MALNILAVTSEAFPLAKTGGLGDAVSGLAQAVDAAGSQVTVMLPAYRDIAQHVRNLRHVAHLQGLPGGDATLLAGHCDELGLPVLLLKNDALYDRDGLYMDPDGVEFQDNAVRFAALAQAAARVAEGMVSVPRPHIVHTHDWHTALTPLYMRQHQVKDVKTVLTLHNIAFQGVFPMSVAASLGIEDRFLSDDGAEFWGRLSFLKAGIKYADLVTVVSQNYAREILTPKFGCGLEGVLAQRGSDLVAIPNGIDTTLWNPEADVCLPGRTFGVDSLHNKVLNKMRLQQRFNLDINPDAILLAMGSRLTTQKMADVAAQAIPLALDAHPSLQACVLGHGDKVLEAALSEVAVRYPGRCSVHIGFDEAQAHLLHAGADILLHGSRFEPFGLTPLYSMRYGTIPIGSRVGGMADTIIDPGAGAANSDMQGATGILFEGERPQDMVAAISRAMALHAQPKIWRAMQKNGMKADFSWARMAPAYLRAYQALRPDVPLDRIPERRRGYPLGNVTASALTTLEPLAPGLATPKTQGLRKIRKGLRDALGTAREASAA